MQGDFLQGNKRRANRYIPKPEMFHRRRIRSVISGKICQDIGNLLRLN